MEMDVWTRIDHFMAEAQDALQSGKYARLKKSRYLHKGDSYDVVDEIRILIASKMEGVFQLSFPTKSKVLKKMILMRGICW